jgi:import inner membrane translocase subunit TIM13
MDGLGGDVKEKLMTQVKQEAAMTNARQLIEVYYAVLPHPNYTYVVLTIYQKVNEHCFEKCVPKPGSSLSSGETSCFTNCMEKYMAAWNTVSKQYINRIQAEQGKAAGGMF